MNHTECQEAIAFDDLEAPALEHLAHCEACATLADDMRRLDALALELADIPPDDLADRVLSGLGQLPDPTVVAFRPRGARSGALRDASRSLGVRLTAAAAVLVLAVAVLTVVGERRQANPADVILASAQSTAAAGTARVRVRAATEVVLDAPPPRAPGQLPPAPDFAAAPDELRAEMEAQWQQAMVDFRVQLEGFLDEAGRNLETGSRRMDDALRQMQRQLDQSLRQFGRQRGRVPPPPRPPAQRPQPPAPQPREDTQRTPPTPPGDIRTEVVVEGRGVVDFEHDRLALNGSVNAGGGQAPFKLAARADTAVYRGGARPWARLPGRAGPVGALVLDPQAVVRMAEAATGVVAEGAAVIGGETLEAYRFDVAAQAMGEQPTAGTWQARGFVGADGRLRRVELTSHSQSADAVRWRTRVTMDLSDYGTATDVAAVPATARTTQLPRRSSLALYPFNDSVRAAQQGRQP